jgi:hypothetical protein
VLVDARDWRSGFISRADVADFLVKQVNDASLVHKTPALIGVRNAEAASSIALEQSYLTLSTRGRLGRNRVLRLAGAF